MGLGFNKIGDLLRNNNKKKWEKITKPYVLELYKNDTEIATYTLSYDNSENVLLDILKLFSAYEDYRIVYDLSKNKILILFTVKKTGDIEI